MTPVDTDVKAGAFLQNTGMRWFRTGSRVICNPPVMNTDADFVVLCDSQRGHERIEEAGFINTSEDHGDDYGARDAPFTTYRCGEVNLIVTDAEWFFTNWCGATDIAKRLNLLDKADRIALFQGVLYGNWDTWLSKGA